MFRFRKNSKFLKQIYTVPSNVVLPVRRRENLIYMILVIIITPTLSIKSALNRIVRKKRFKRQLYSYMHSISIPCLKNISEILKKLNNSLIAAVFLADRFRSKCGALCRRLE